MLKSGLQISTLQYLKHEQTHVLQRKVLIVYIVFPFILAGFSKSLGDHYVQLSFSVIYIATVYCKLVEVEKF